MLICTATSEGVPSWLTAVNLCGAMMDYNWGDPKKNSLLSSRMMAKAEVTRKKKLTSVKSTLSNQLHPTIEHKIRKKKKAFDSARRPLQHPQGDNEKPRSSCSNNDTHDADQTEPQFTSDDEASTLDTIRQDGIPLPACAPCASNVSMFDEFGLNAAADGLFHPASTIEAFAEHDAKYRQEVKSTPDKLWSGPRRARSGSEYPPSRENHRLPLLHNGKTKFLPVRHDVKYQPASYRGSAPASMTTASSLSKLLATDDKNRSLSATQSDSNLYAPRRQDAVPSSADRNALDFLERDLESDDDNNRHHSPVTNLSQAISEHDNNEIPGSSVVPPLDFSLARRFEELKKIIKSNREKHNSDRQNGKQPKQPNDEVSPGESEAGQLASSTTTVHAAHSGGPVNARSAIHASSSGSSSTKNGGAKGTLKKRSAPATRATADMKNSHGPSGSKWALPIHVSGAASRKITSSVTVAVSSRSRSKEEMKVRSGVSLSDLKAEHREALQMLKELGGPVDPDYLQADVVDDTNLSKGYRPGRNTTGTNRPSGSTMTLAGRKSTTHLQAQAPPVISTPPTSANPSNAFTVSMVTKLRESVSSGRGSSRESSPQTSSSGDTPLISSARKEKKDEATRPNQRAVPETTADITAAVEKVSLVDPEPVTAGSSLPPHLSPNKTLSDPWKQHEDDTDEEDGDNNELEHDNGSEIKAALTSGDRYSDEDFESDW